uniref:Immunoglobulin V-set domain-containing protein n=1 Tax=Cyprinus carpio TaxID=7962 RepID=A0A8C1WY85_CYPCA
MKNISQKLPISLFFFSSSVTLSCNFSASGSNDYLHWYRQYGRSKPEFLVLIYINAKQAEVSKIDPRFSVNIPKTTTRTSTELTITDVRLSDSALYYLTHQVKPKITFKM